MSAKKSKAKKKPSKKKRKANKAAMDAADKRLVKLDQIDSRIAAAPYDPEFHGTPENLSAIAARSSAARQKLQKEIELRQKVEDSYANSSSPDPDADPAVQQAQKELNAFLKPPNTAAGKSPVGAAVTKCSHDIAALAPNTPYWNIYHRKTKNGIVTTAGPAYPKGQYPLKDSPAWDTLIQNGVKTPSEKRVICTMSKGEGGNLDDVNAYDSQIVSLGAMQKTIDPRGYGELPQQMLDLQNKDPDKYNELFASKGWTVEKDEETGKARAYYQDPMDQNRGPMTGSELMQYIRQKDRPDIFVRALDPFRHAGSDPVFQQLQIMDFNTRLIDAGKVRLPKHKHKAKYKHRSGEYLSSEKGRAMLLDQSVNSPGTQPGDLEKALDKFYLANPSASQDPAEWGDNRPAYESEILDNYSQDRRMTDSNQRAAGIMGSDSSDQPGSMEFPPPAASGP